MDLSRLSNSDAYKQALAGLLRRGGEVTDFIATAPEKAGQAILEGHEKNKALQAQAFANPNRPFQVTNQQAMGELGDRMLAGPLSVAPVGMTSMEKILVNIPISAIEHGESAMAGGKLTFPNAKQTIKEYASRKTDFPPIEVVSNEAGSKVPWMIADGSHRLEAAKLRGNKTIQAYVSPFDKEGLDLASQMSRKELLQQQIDKIE
jgi:uncharacterized ParB-like nuclease family protein